MSGEIGREQLEHTESAGGYVRSSWVSLLLAPVNSGFNLRNCGQ